MEAKRKEEELKAKQEQEAHYKFISGKTVEEKYSYIIRRRDYCYIDTIHPGNAKKSFVENEKIESGSEDVKKKAKNPTNMTTRLKQ